ncbi:hypothetical protein HK101_006129, partial [Irineochytrium annulatum]
MSFGGLNAQELWGQLTEAQRVELAALVPPRPQTGPPAPTAAEAPTNAHRPAEGTHPVDELVKQLMEQQGIYLRSFNATMSNVQSTMAQIGSQISTP